MEHNHYDRLRQQHRVKPASPPQRTQDAPIPFPPTPLTGRPFDDDRTGMRQRLRREATLALVVHAELSTERVPLRERTQALQVPWLEALFHTSERVERVLDPAGLAIAASSPLEEKRRTLPASAVRSEVTLMEAIQQHLTIMRLAAEQLGRPRLSRLRQERRWSELRDLTILWEATLSEA